MDKKELDKKIKRNKIIEVCEIISCICSWISIIFIILVIPALFLYLIFAQLNYSIILIPTSIVILSMFIMSICETIIYYLSPHRSMFL